MHKDAEGRPTYSLEATVEIGAPAARVWALLIDPERWWMEAHDAHVAMQAPSGRLAEGGRWVMLERVAGVLGVADGRITACEESRLLTWHAPTATYRFLAIPVKVDERITWTVEPSDGRTRLSLQATDSFGAGPSGRAVAWVFERLLGGVRRDTVHAMRELGYLRRRLEGDPGDAG
jgi:uncharacterized protein YndB with AHSA1/START domain